MLASGIDLPTALAAVAEDRPAQPVCRSVAYSVGLLLGTLAVVIAAVILASQ
jgi:hypothetical protein